MPSTSACWGIEVGAHAIKALKLEAVGDGSVKLADWALIPHPKVLSTPGVDPNDVIRVSLGALANQVDLGKASIAVSIPGHSSFARFAKLPPVEPKKVAEIIKFEAQQQIPFPLEQVEWDYQTFKVADSPELEVGIFAVTKERINERMQTLDEVGIAPNFVSLSPIAVYNALAFDLDFSSSTAGTIIVDIGTTSTDLVIATPGRMWVRTFPLGGHQFTEALVNQFQLSYPKAEKLKREAQDTKHARQVFQAMRPVFTDLAQDIQRSIGYFQSLHPDAQLSRVIGVGETWRLPGLRKYLKQQLGMDVYRIESFKKLGTGGGGDLGGGGGGGGGGEDSEEGGEQKTVDPNDRNAAFNEASVAMATAYGLALQGLDLNAVKGNLMPVTSIRRSMWKEKGKWFAAAAGVAAAAGAVMFISPLRAQFAAAATNPDPAIQQTVNTVKNLVTQATEANATKTGEADMRAANIASIVQHRDGYAYLMRDLQDMFAFANDKAKNWSPSPGQPPVAIPANGVLNLVYARTNYYGPSGPPAEGGAAQASVEFPTIDVQIQISTAAPEARRFLNDTVAKWLRDNAKRADVPYEIEYSTEFLDRDAPSTGQGRAGRAETPGREERQERTMRAGGRLTDGVAGRGGAGGGAGGSAGETGAQVAGEARAIRAGGGSGEGSVNDLAPLEPSPDQVPPPTVNRVLAFQMVFKPPTPPAESTDAPGAAGSAGKGGGK